MKSAGYLKKLAPVLLLLALWQGGAMLMNEKLLLASPVDVIVRLCTIWREPEFFPSVGFSLFRICSGFLLGFFSGTLLAVLAGKLPAVEAVLRPVMMLIRSVPVASFVILALIWLSSSGLSVFISFLMVLPVIYTNVLAGIKTVDGKMLAMADIFRLPWGKRFVFLWLPAIRPQLFSGCRTALGLAWKSGIAAEVIGIPSGSMGEMLYNAKVYLNTVDLFAWTAVIVLASFLFEKLFLALLNFAYGRLEKL